jgi:hypothetical protein
VYNADYTQDVVLSSFLSSNNIQAVNASERAILGDSGNNTLDFRNVTFKVVGYSTVTYIDGGAGNDLMYANNEGLHLKGGTGNDVIYGGSGSDILEGGDGSDQLISGGGKDQLWGGSIGSPDTSINYFAFLSTATGSSTVMDFRHGTDRIDLRLFSGTPLTLVKVGAGPQPTPAAGIVFAQQDPLNTSDLILTLPSGQKVRIKNLLLSALTPGTDFYNVQ